jgi:hypothetical protein
VGHIAQVLDDLPVTGNIDFTAPKVEVAVKGKF